MTARLITNRSVIAGFEVVCVQVLIQVAGAVGKIVAAAAFKVPVTSMIFCSECTAIGET